MLDQTKPVYQRLRDVIANAILDGTYRDGDMLPSVRSLAAEEGADYAALVTATELDRLTTEVDLAVPTDLRGPPLPARSARALGLRVVEATGIFQHFALPDAAPHAELHAAG